MQNSNVIELNKVRPRGPNGHPFKTVVLECPYESLLENGLAKTIFPDLIELKIKGYLKEYPFGVLPLESADFVANHIILCEEAPDSLIPHMAFKSISVDRCNLHYLEFPIYHMIHAARTKEEQSIYQQVADDIIQKAKEAGHTIGYNGSWTVSPELRKMKGGINYWEATMTLIANYYRHYGVQEIIAAASTRFKVDRAKVFMGFDYFKVNNEKLKPIRVASYDDEEAYIMHLKEFSPELLALCNLPLYKSLWENRLVISAKDQKSLKETG